MKKIMSILLIVGMLLTGGTSIFAAEPEIKGAAMAEPRGMEVQVPVDETVSVTTKINGENKTFTVRFTGSYKVYGTTGSQYVGDINLSVISVKSSDVDFVAKVSKFTKTANTNNVTVTITVQYHPIGTTAWQTAGTASRIV